MNNLDKAFYQKVITELNVSRQHLKEAFNAAENNNSLPIHVLIENKLVDPNTILTLFSRHYGIQVADLDSMDIPQNIVQLIDKELAKRFRFIPIDRVGQNIIIAMTNPMDLKLLDLIRFKTGYIPKPVIATQTSIMIALAKYYKDDQIDIGKLVGTDVIKQRDDSQDRTIINDKFTKGDETSGAIINLVNQILVQCLTRGASDIHIEPYETFLRVRLRIDGVLHEIARPPESYKNPLISRIKIMSRLNIAEKRRPQDGGIRVTIEDKPIDFRVSTCPTLYGEKVVLRILDKSNLQVDMTKLGFEQDDFQKFKQSILRPYGMVLVTGPTGSGKTTTLYSALAELNKSTSNVLTAEDPVEFNLEGINQVQINPAINFDFSHALRSFLRQDPDVIMVGEIRDAETGSIAIKAALTGHLVLSTLHTNSAADTITRLQTLGLDSFNIISSLNAIIAQRLVRRLCSHCKVPNKSLMPAHLIKLGIAPQFAENVTAFKAVGCARCVYSGYKGRIAIFEVMTADEPIKEAIMAHKSTMDLKKIAMEHGMRSLRQSALNKMAQGETDVVEVVKVTTSDTDDDYTGSESDEIPNVSGSSAMESHDDGTSVA